MGNAGFRVLRRGRAGLMKGPGASIRDAARSGRRGPERRDPIPSPPHRVLRELVLGGREPLPLLRATGGPARACQYIGDAKGNARDWAVCGKRSVAGRSYCQEHVEICYQGGSKGGENLRK